MLSIPKHQEVIGHSCYLLLVAIRPCLFDHAHVSPLHHITLNAVALPHCVVSFTDNYFTFCSLMFAQYMCIYYSDLGTLVRLLLAICWWFHLPWSMYYHPDVTMSFRSVTVIGFIVFNCSSHCYFT